MAKTFCAPPFRWGKTSRAPPSHFVAPPLPVISDQSLMSAPYCWVLRPYFDDPYRTSKVPHLYVPRICLISTADIGLGALLPMNHIHKIVTSEIDISYETQRLK